MPYIKSHSNYVLQSKHQNISDGTIFERDITTIGGVSDFPNGQTPIYRSSSFIVSVRSGSKPSNQYNTEKWQENDVSGTVWNLQSISGLTSDIDEDNDTKIVLKQDYYDLSDFAYYGSLTELFRTSVTDIVSRFPGELYATNSLVYYTSSSFSEDFDKVEERTILGASTLVEVVNPFGINLHSNTKLEGGDELKYFADGGYKNYEIIDGNNTFSIDSWNSTWYYFEANPNKTSSADAYICYTATTSSNTIVSEVSSRPYPCKGDKAADVKLVDVNGREYDISAWIGDNNEIHYLHEISVSCSDVNFLSAKACYSIDIPSVVTYVSNSVIPNIVEINCDDVSEYTIIPDKDSGTYCGGEVTFSLEDDSSGKTSDYWHIRPKKEFLDKFYNECDSFEKLLMNRDTDYKAVFSVIRENDYGYYRELVPFQFPKGEGGYNIDTSDYGFNAYTEQMVKIGEYYDEKFTDNLWRSMTHEAIKNFDWTYTREYQEGNEEEYIFGGQRIQKALRLFAREFDEILSYINNIKALNRITYDERSNLPDYFLTDAVENMGWDVKLIYPYQLIEKDASGNTYIEYTKEGGKANCQGQLDNTNDMGVAITREFTQNANSIVTPYKAKSDDYGYFSICSGSSCSSSKSVKVAASASTDTVRFDKCALGGKGALKNVIRTYYDDSDWSFQKCNNEFLRRLKINSPYIWRHKGTIEGIEMILGLFGLKSDRWSTNGKGDYRVNEYTSFAYRIAEPWDAVHQDYRINWVNSTKTIAYDNRSISNYNKYGIESTTKLYQGIPVAYRDEYDSVSKKYVKKKSLEEQITNGVTSISSVGFKKEDGTPVIMRYLYPYFNSKEELDGNPYFQMNGGWLSKVIGSGATNHFTPKWNFQYDVDNNIVYTKYADSNETLYKETVRNIRRVDNINQLLTIPTNDLHNGIICNVSKIENNGAVIDGVLYTIQSEWDGNVIKEYISFVKTDGYVKVGLDKYFDSTMIVYNSNLQEETIDIENKGDGYEIKAYISGDSFVCKEDSNGDYTISSFAKLDSIWNDDNFTSYFILNDVNYASEIARFNSDTSGFTSGWRRLTKSDSDYIKINTIVNYNKGNNPHNGNMVYDNGYEYLTYFKKIFKYAYENELFDPRCYDDFYKTLDEEISKYGFEGLIDDNQDSKSYNIYEDTKVHYFGNYKEAASNGKINYIHIYGDDEARRKGFEKVYVNDTNASNIKKYSLGNEPSYILGGSPYPSGSSVDEVTNQIINTKRLDITFKLHHQWYSNQGQCELKYIDDIIMNYLTQMIPSSTILQIRYTYA